MPPFFQHYPNNFTTRCINFCSTALSDEEHSVINFTKSVLHHTTLWFPSFVSIKTSFKFRLVLGRELLWELSFCFIFLHKTLQNSLYFTNVFERMDKIVSCFTPFWKKSCAHVVLLSISSDYFSFNSSFAQWTLLTLLGLHTCIFWYVWVNHLIKEGNHSFFVVHAGFIKRSNRKYKINLMTGHSTEDKR